jgi:NADH-quinone oxidoreductase subunit A
MCDKARVSLVPPAMLVLAVSLSLAALLPATRRQVGRHEHGGRTSHKTWVQFRVRYGVLALLFVAFDMEMVFMFPWAVAYRREGIIALGDMLVFVAILGAAIAFAWKEGAFDWED